MSFDDTGREPEQAFRLNRDPRAELEYPTKWEWKQILTPLTVLFVSLAPTNSIVISLSDKDMLSIYYVKSIWMCLHPPSLRLKLAFNHVTILSWFPELPVSPMFSTWLFIYQGTLGQKLPGFTTLDSEESIQRWVLTYPSSSNMWSWKKYLFKGNLSNFQFVSPVLRMLSVKPTLYLITFLILGFDWASFPEDLLYCSFSVLVAPFDLVSSWYLFLWWSEKPWSWVMVHLSSVVWSV